MAKHKFLTISRVAHLLGVSPSLLRNWEQRGLVAPSRSRGRYRLYSADMIRQLKRVRYLRRVKGINASGILQLQRRDTELAVSADAPPVNIGERLAGVRAELGLTLTEAAARSGLRAATVASLERGLSRPSVAALKTLAESYGTSVLALYGAQGATRGLVRTRERRVLSELGMRIELLAFGGRRMRPVLVRVEPRSTSGGSYAHDGEEFLYMLSGKFEIWLDEVEHYILEPGDSLYFLSTRTHRWRTVGDEEAVLIWMNSPAGN